jgi:hypothetical protein
MQWSVGQKGRVDGIAINTTVEKFSSYIASQNATISTERRVDVSWQIQKISNPSQRTAG